MDNLFINHLNEKDVDHFTTELGLLLRRNSDKPFKIACNTFTNANIIRVKQDNALSDEEYFSSLDCSPQANDQYSLKKGKNNIVLERYPELDSSDSYIFVCNHTCPEDIETVLNIIDRNAYLVLGSIDTLKHNPEAYLLWLNGMIPFDILDAEERKELTSKMNRVLNAGNSILIFPEGSHNYHPNKIINNLFDGVVNSAIQTRKKIVPITLMRDGKNLVSYIDVGNPIDIFSLNINIHDYYPNEKASEKYYVKSLTSYIRDKMATSVYYMMSRHFSQIKRNDYQDIEDYFKRKYIEEAFTKLKWASDIFEAEYLVKKTREEKEYEAVVSSLANLRYNEKAMVNPALNIADYILKQKDIESKDVAGYMREYWLKSSVGNNNVKKLAKK